MCLGIAGQVVRWIDRRPGFTSAELEFDGVRRPCQMACVPDAEIGDYVIVHAGVAITRIDPVEAARVFEELARLEDDESAAWRDAEPGEGTRG